SRRSSTSQTSNRRLPARARLFLRLGIPFAALFENRVFYSFPNPVRSHRRQRLILLRFVNLLFFRQFCGQVLLRRLLGYLIHTWAHFRVFILLHDLELQTLAI